MAEREKMGKPISVWGEVKRAVFQTLAHSFYRQHKIFIKEHVQELSLYVLYVDVTSSGVSRHYKCIYIESVACKCMIV